MNHLIDSYGYWAVALFVGVESLGVPLPGETALILAGIYAGHTHKLSIWAIFAVAAAAAIVGDNIGYWIGDTGGYRLLRRYGHYVRFDETKFKIGRYLFDRHGGKVVFFGRFVSVLRTYAAFLAGTNRMHWRRFLIFNAAGGIIWAAIFSFVSYVAGDALRRESGTINLVLGIVAAVVIVIVLLVIRRQSGKLAEKAEAAYPGSLDDARPKAGKQA
jgi:membrane protein DedA with SNARE-associated domain